VLFRSRADWMAALALVLRHHGFALVPDARLWSLTEWGSRPLIEALSTHCGIEDRSGSMAAQLWNVFLMRGCQSSSLLPPAVRLVRGLRPSSSRILIDSDFPLEFVEVVLGRFRLDGCTVVAMPLPARHGARRTPVASSAATTLALSRAAAATHGRGPMQDAA
jgi:hypothetical protein